MHNPTAMNKSLLNSVNRKVDKAFSKSEADNLKKFARHYFASSAISEISQITEQQIYDSVVDAWQFIKERRPGRVKIEFKQRKAARQSTQGSGTSIYVLLNDMPFLVDSIRQGLNRSGVSIRDINNAVIWVDRSGSKERKPGALRQFATKETDSYSSEAISCFNCAPLTKEQCKEVEAEIRNILDHVTAAVKDYRAMCNKATEIREALKSATNNSLVVKQEVEESSAFLSWLLENHFTFLGLESYAISGRKSALKGKLDQKSLLGISRLKSVRDHEDGIGPVTAGSKDRTLARQLCVFSKSSLHSKVHRPAYYDCILIKEYDEQGNLKYEHRLIGLYTSSVYYRAALEIPLVRRKVETVLERSGFTPRGHSYKDLLQVINVLPRDELFQISTEQLFATALEITRIQETRTSKLFIRKDVYGHYFSCLVYVPRDIYSTEVRLKIQQLLKDALNAEKVEFNTYFSESILARIHLTLRSPDLEQINYDEDELEARMVQLIKPWNDVFIEALQADHSESEARDIAARYAASFAPAYREVYGAIDAVGDIKQIDHVLESRNLALNLAPCQTESGAELRFKIYSLEHQLLLSDVDPILENLGLNIISEKAFRLTPPGGETVWLHDFSLFRKKPSDAEEESGLKQRFEEAFNAVWHRKVDDDDLNELVVAAGLGWRDIAMLRAYTGYLKQVQFSYSLPFIAATLSEHETVTCLLVRYFHSLFDPSLNKSRKKRSQELRIKILAAIDNVANLSEDSVLRAFLNLFDATLRTNYFQHDDNSQSKNYFSFKFNPEQINGIPRPKPKFEIFVFSRNMEGVHLRGGKVARGGLRWSDRLEDYRTEVLGLVKAQQVKNSVIVPVGAKGGFVIKEALPAGDRKLMTEAGVRHYKTFIRGLLDITDNVVEGKLVAPRQVVRRDDDDPYLVVAADKGTATFSDIANEIALEYGFWLGDGFASGGSNGYDHKQMGITAKGAWVSAQRHFRELGKNIQKEDFTVVGIGDMSGDVFGNGMLLSKHICLVAAFNHLHIFVDPNPDSAASYKERKRLFNQTGSSWADYNEKLISNGGGIFSRSAKSLKLTAEMKDLFTTDEDTVTPDQLIKLILKSPVELIWNGGIGTYIKAESQSHADVGDKANDGLRVAASELRCQVIAEGGNLGVTQEARVEFGIHGGISLTDFIDNSAGVDCSDHEVNIKILLNEVARAGKLTEQRRNSLLESMTDDVADLVLDNNYSQVQAIGLANSEMHLRHREYAGLIAYLEENAGLDRALEFLPRIERLEERTAHQQHLTRPEIAVLTSYMKMHLKARLVEVDYLDNDYLLPYLYSAFPQKLHSLCRAPIKDHPLRREIIATQLANAIVNLLGPSFVYRMVDSTACSIAEVVKATVIALEVFQLESIWTQVESLDYKIDASVQNDMMTSLTRMIRQITRWFLRNRRGGLSFEAEVKFFRDRITRFSGMLPDKLPPEFASLFEDRFARLTEKGVPTKLAQDVCRFDFLLPTTSFIEISQDTGENLGNVVETYYAIGEALRLNWLAKTIDQLPVANYWQARARETYLDDLAWQQRALTNNVVTAKNCRGSTSKRVSTWVDRHASPLDRARQVLGQLEAEAAPDYAMFSVTLRELLNLSQSTAHSD